MSRARRGFTLLELTVGLSVIGILGGIAVPVFQAAIERADAASVVSDARNVELAVRTYYEDAGTLPRTAGWGVVPAEIADLVGGIDFTHEDLTYRLITQRRRGVTRLRVRYPRNHPIGVALQRYQSPGRVVWNPRRTDFYLVQ